MKYFTFFLIFLWGIILFCDLKFEERFEAQKKIEKVYYEKRIWPNENQNTKPPFEEVITEEILKNKVVEYIKKSILLEEIWKKPITGEQLQAEMNRMVKNTKDPETLKKLFEALRNDPFLIAECLARPVLADRLIRNWYAFDERFHGQLKKEAENLRKEITIENFEYIAKDKFQRIIIKKENGFREKEEGVIYLKEEEFERALKEYPEENEISKVEETAEGFLIKISYKKDENEISGGIIFFQKNTFDEWFKKESKLTDNNLYIEFYEYKIPEFNEKNKTFMDSSDAWLNFGHFPKERREHTAVWTGSEMIIWGGSGNGYQNTGGRYNPSTDTWTETSTINAPSPRINHTAVWTGNEMIIWGGFPFTSTGGRYYPSTNIWEPTSTTNAPSEREYHTAVWTGNEMIVWGGYDGTNFLNTGGRYYPPADTWASTGMSNVPSPRKYHKAIWTGNGMIVWGGYPYTNAGGIYYPLADAWASMNLSNSPDPREGHTAVWTGDEMIIWGGNYESYYYNTGGRYSPIADSWIPTSTTGVPSARAWHTAVWTGQSMIVWDGCPTTQSGGIYFPYCSPFQFNNIAPLSGSIDQPLNNLTIDWEDSKYAKSYDLYFGTSSPPPLYQSNLSSSIYALNGLQSNTTYYWYVVAKNSCGKRAGEVWSFTTCILPSNFNNLSPENNSINISAKNLLLDWEDSSSAETYNLYFGYTNPPPLFKTGIMQSQFTIPALAKYGTYYWYVEAINSCGNKISEIFSFKTYDPDNIDKGTVYDWGWNYFGQLGDGTNNDSNVLIQVLNLTNIIEIAGGKNHSLALKDDGTVWAWGLNLTGQLGNGTYSNSNIPVQTLNLTNIIAIAGGGYHSLALKDDGTVWAWGYNYHGQLGNGTNNHSNIPVQVLNISNVVAISAGGYHSLALKTDGTVWAWGHNLQGQLGNGTNTDSNIPVQVLNLTDVVSIAGGYLHSLAIRSDGTVWAWGYNGYGQLGDGTNDWSNVPVQTLNLSNVIRVAGGGGLVEYSGHSLALKDNGTVWAWGMNDYGQLGDGTNNHSNIPVQVLNLTGTVGISGGGGHSIALKDNGTVWTWGRNNYGQLGNGTNVSSNIPVQVLNLINPVEIANGMDHSLSIECLIPANFSNLTPENDSINQSTYGLLIDWEDSFNAKSYDLYLGIENPPSLYQSNIQESQYILNGLSYNTTYYWYIVAKNSCSTKTGATWQFTTAPQPKVIPDGSATTIPVMARKNNVIGTELEISWDGQCNPQNANIIYGPLSEISNYTITGSKCDNQNPDIWNIGETSNIWFVIVSDNGAGIESSWGLNSSGEHRNGTNASSQCGNNLRDNSGTCP